MDRVGLPLTAGNDGRRHGKLTRHVTDGNSKKSPSPAHLAGRPGCPRAAKRSGPRRSPGAARASVRGGPDLEDVLDLRADVRFVASRLPAILAVIAAALADRRRVYVHCNAGFNRAPTVAIAFLRAHRGLSDEAAWAHVKQRRACAPYRRALELHFDDPAGR